MIDFDKKLKGGLKKCPLHRFGSTYKPVKKGWYECEICHNFYKMPDEIYREVEEEWRVRIFNNGKAWTFL